jgi:hypothetical protein
MTSARMLVCLTALCVAVPALAKQRIGGVALAPESAFNPTQGERVRLVYELAEPDAVTVRVYDPDAGLVRNVVESAHRDPGRHEESWDGRDLDGRVVPDEAYTFAIETASGAVYDPTTLSGGTVGDVTAPRFDAERGTLEYRLPHPARVLIRCGVHDGPMLRTLVDWKPRAAGPVTEYWDGRDESNVLAVREHKSFSALVTYVTLPDATVLTYGNAGEAYASYKLGRAKDRPARPVRPRTDAGGLRPEGLVPPAWAHAPRVLMTFPNADGGPLAEVRGSAEVRIDVEPGDRDRLVQEQFEVMFYVDTVFFAEAERGYLPYTWRWELAQVPAGEHVLTVNISSFKGQVGVASRKVRVVKPAK